MENVKIVNDLHWLGWAKDAADKTIDEIEKGAHDLDIFVEWLWGIYTTLYVIGTITLSALHIPVWIIWLLAVPIITLIIAKWLCSNAQLPINVNIDPIVPLSIKNGYNILVRKKQKRLKYAQAVTLLSVVLVAVGLAFCFVKRQAYQERKQQAPVIAHSCILSNDSLVVSGVFPANTKTFISIAKSDTVNRKIPVFVESKTLTDGIFSLGLKKDNIKNADTVFVTLRVIYENKDSTVLNNWHILRK